MAFYSQELINEVREKNDITEVISAYVNLERRGNKYFGHCPFHNEKTPSFCVTPHNQLFYCFGCHESGNVISFMMKQENMEFTEAIEALAERVGIRLESQHTGENYNIKKRKREELLAVNKAAAEYYYKLLRTREGERGFKYFTDRGLHNSMLNSFGLGYTGQGSGKLNEHLSNNGFSDEIQMEAGLITFDEKSGKRDRFFNRVIFPIMDQGRHVIGFGARVMGDGQPKYLNSRESDVFKKKETLYGLFAARRSQRKEFILCEGYMDVITAHSFGFDNAIATLGTALTIEHANILSKFHKPIYLCYDSDNAGKQAARRGYEILRQVGLQVKIIELSPYKDPDEFINKLGVEEFEKRIYRADNALYIIKKWDFEKIDQNNPDERTEFVHGLYESIREFKDESAREEYIRRFAKDFNIDSGILKRGVNNIKTAPGQGLKYKKSIKSNLSPEMALKINEARLLYYLLDRGYFEKCGHLVEKRDFKEKIFQEIFENIRSRMNENKPVLAADIISNIEDEKLNKFLIRNFFEAQEEKDRGDTGSEREVMLKVKRASLKRIDNERTDKSLAATNEFWEITKEVIDEIEQVFK